MASTQRSKKKSRSAKKKHESGLFRNSSSSNSGSERSLSSGYQTPTTPEFSINENKLNSHVYSILATETPASSSSSDTDPNPPPVSRQSSASKLSAEKNNNDSQLSERIRNAVLVIQKAIRVFLANLPFIKRRRAAVKLQKAVRRKQMVTNLAYRMKTIVTLQKYSRLFLAKQALKVKRNAAIILQAAARRTQPMKNLQQSIKAATKLQAAVRRQQALQRFNRSKKAAIKVQTIWRRLLARQAFKNTRIAAITVQARARRKKDMLELQKSKVAAAKLQAAIRRQQAIRKLIQSRDAVIYISSIYRRNRAFQELVARRKYLAKAYMTERARISLEILSLQNPKGLLSRLLNWLNPSFNAMKIAQLKRLQEQINNPERKIGESLQQNKAALVILDKRIGQSLLDFLRVKFITKTYEAELAELAEHIMNRFQLLPPEHGKYNISAKKHINANTLFTSKSLNTAVFQTQMALEKFSQQALAKPQQLKEGVETTARRIASGANDNLQKLTQPVVYQYRRVVQDVSKRTQPFTQQFNSYKQLANDNVSKASSDLGQMRKNIENGAHHISEQAKLWSATVATKTAPVRAKFSNCLPKQKQKV